MSNQTFYVIKRNEDAEYIGFDQDENGNDVPYFSALYKADLYVSRDVAEDDLKNAKEQGWSGLKTARIVKIEIREIDP